MFSKFLQTLLAGYFFSFHLDFFYLPPTLLVNATRGMRLIYIYVIYIIVLLKDFLSKMSFILLKFIK